ncbi:MAG: peptidylprolyl isomerase [Chitinophagales bacterium]
MIIENRTVVSLNYRLTIDDGGVETEVEVTDEFNPFVFLFGTQSVLPKFDESLAGKTIGDAFDFRLTPEEGYGVSNEQNIINIPINAFLDANGQPDPELLAIGKTLTMNDHEGRMYRGEVKEVNDDSVLMDFNHPLADKTLHFTGEVVDVRLATLEELQHGHAHSAGGHHH